MFLKSFFVNIWCQTSHRGQDQDGESAILPPDGSSEWRQPSGDLESQSNLKKMNSGTLEVFDIFSLKEVTCVTMKCQCQRAADCCLEITYVFTGVNKGSRGNEGVRTGPFLSHQRCLSLTSSWRKWHRLKCRAAARACGDKLCGGSAKEVVSIFSRFYKTGSVERRHACLFWPPQKSRDTFQKHGLMSWMLDCHLRAEGAAAGLVLPNHGWGCLTAQKPIQH